ncbi:hypothetical protein [Embleya sp. NPDC001921]
MAEAGWFTAASVLVHCILGAAGQNAANAACRREATGLVEADVFVCPLSAWWEAPRV